MAWRCANAVPSPPTVMEADQTMTTASASSAVAADINTCAGRNIEGFIGRRRGGAGKTDHPHFTLVGLRRDDLAYRRAPRRRGPCSRSVAVDPRAVGRPSAITVEPIAGEL